MTKSNKGKVGKLSRQTTLEYESLTPYDKAFCEKLLEEFPSDEAAIEPAALALKLDRTVDKVYRCFYDRETKLTKGELEAALEKLYNPIVTLHELILEFWPEHDPRNSDKRILPFEIKQLLTSDDIKPEPLLDNIHILKKQLDKTKTGIEKKEKTQHEGGVWIKSLFEIWTLHFSSSVPKSREYDQDHPFYRFVSQLYSRLHTYLTDEREATYPLKDKFETKFKSLPNSNRAIFDRIPKSNQS